MRSALLLSALSVASVSAASLEEKLRTARNAFSQVQRINALEDSDYVFDFLNPPQQTISQGAGGRTVAATSASFPGVIGNGVAMTIGFMGPCGFNTPHTHPRATEFNFAVNGTMITGMLQENGARYVFNTVPPGSATIFPRGAIHFEMNDGCEPMIFVAGFNDEDPGTSGVAQRLFGLTPEYTAATLGDFGIEEIRDLEAQIPNNIALGIDACLKKCGIPKGTSQPTTQRQPRVAGNSFPANSGSGNSNSNSSPPPARPPTSNPSPSSSYPQPTTNSSPPVTPATNNNAAAPPSSQQQQPVSALGGFAANNESSSGGGRGSDPVLIALLVIVTLMMIGYLAIGFLWLKDRRAQQTGYAGRGTGFNPLREKGHASTYSLGGAKYDDPAHVESHMEYTDRRIPGSPPPTR